MPTFVVITGAFVTSVVLAEIMHHFKYPRVIGQILAGIILGLPLLSQYFTSDALVDIEFLANLGVIFLFLMIGLEIDIHKFKQVTKPAFVEAAFGIAIPFILGFGVMKFMDFSTSIALLVGIALSITAQATTAQVLLELKALNSKVGRILIGAGFIDDLFGIISLSILVTALSTNSENLLLMPVKFILFASAVYLIFKIIPRILHHLQHEHSRIATFSMVVAIGLLIAILAQALGVGEIIGAFLGGLLINFYGEHKCNKTCPTHCHKKGYQKIRRDSIEELKVITLSFVIPFFFIHIGLQFSLVGILYNLPLIAFITTIAIIGKLAAAMIAGRFLDLTKTQSMIIGWGMNSRGTIELVMANLALAAGIINQSLFTAIVAMAIITTLTFPLFMKSYIKKDPKGLG